MTRRRFRRMVRHRQAVVDLARLSRHHVMYDSFTGKPEILAVPDPRAGRVFRGWQHERPVSP
jgi:hypothetical protein